MKRYFKNILVGLDQLLNAILGGDPDETISSRSGKMARDTGHPLAVALCLIFHIFDREHCKKSLEDDEGKDSIF